MGTMRFEGLSIAGKMFVLLLTGCLIFGGYYGYLSYKFSAAIEKGNIYLTEGNYDAAVESYNLALKAKSSGGSKAEISSLISNTNTLKDAEITKLKQEITAIIGDKYKGIEGANVIAIRKSYYSAIEIEPVQKKINRQKELNIDKNIIKQYQQILDSQKLQAKKRKR